MGRHDEERWLRKLEASPQADLQTPPVIAGSARIGAVGHGEIDTRSGDARASSSPSMLQDDS